MKKIHHFLKPIIKHVSTTTVVSMLVGAGVVASAWYVVENPISFNFGWGNKYYKVTEGPIVLGVNATGTISTAQKFDLSFPVDGKILSINLPASTSTKIIKEGDVIATLDTKDLEKKLTQAKSSLASAESKLAAANLEKSTNKPTTISANQSASITDAQNAVRKAVLNAQIVSEDAIYNKADQYIQDPHTSNPSLLVLMQDGNVSNGVLDLRVEIEGVLVKWQAKASSSKSFSTITDTLSLAKDAQSKLNLISSFLSKISQGLQKTWPNQTAAQTSKITSYQSSITSARLAISNALSDVKDAETDEIKARASITTANTKAPAGIDIGSLTSAVSSAKAEVNKLQEQINKSKLVSPVDGVIVSSKAKVGQTIKAESTLFTIVPNNSFQIALSISQGQASKIAVGGEALVMPIPTASTTINAFVVSIASSTATSTPQVSSATSTPAKPKVTYTATVQLKNVNSDLIKIGQKAAVTITGKTLPKVLLISNADIVRNGTSTKVTAITGSSTKAVQVPIKTGEQGLNGMVEIKSGLNLGDSVLRLK